MASNVVDGLDRLNSVQVDRSGSFTAYSMNHLALATNDDGVLRMTGDMLTAKRVRRWLWDQRRSRVMRRNRFVVWGVYDNPTNQYHVGLADITSTRCVMRLNERRFRKVAQS